VKYKVGQLVLNKKLGVGKVLGINGDEVLTYFKDEQVNPRTINVGVVPMEIAQEQSDPFFDSEQGSNIARLSKPSKARRPAKPRAPKKEPQPVAE
jgi:hypothetical protein